MTVLFLAIAGAVAILDWIVVARRLFRLEFLLKPAVPALLIAAATRADIGSSKIWTVIALGFGLVGDVLLLGRDPAPGTPPRRRFRSALFAFLLGHLAWIVAFLLRGTHPLPLLAGALVAFGAGGLLLPAVLRAARRSGGRAFAVSVAFYALVLAVSTALAAGTQLVAVAVGGLLFLVSDALLARNRFVARIPHGRLAVIVSYHLAQGLLLGGLVRSF